MSAIGAERDGMNWTLVLKEDDYGLRAEIALPDTQDGRDVAALTARGDIHAMSFGFVPVDVEHMDGGKTQRIREAKLMEVSPVTAWPAYAATTAGVRALAEVLDVDGQDLDAAFRVLTTTTDELTSEQERLLLEAVNARAPKPIGTPAADAIRERLAARGYLN